MLQSLERSSGLPMALDPEMATLRWPEGIAVGSISTRTFSEMREFIAEPAATPSHETVYSVYRNLARPGDSTRIRAQKLRYDITVIPPGVFAHHRREYFRTAGHYHPEKPGTHITYPEVYEVIAGRAHWLLQRPDDRDPAVIKEIYVIEAGPTEKAVMLPGFGHISINAESQPLVIANWISDTFQYDYEPYRRFHGSGYWMFEGPTAASNEFEKNTHYSQVPELRKLRSKDLPEFGLLRSRPLYSLTDRLEKLDFLHTPEAFADLLTLDRCYQPVV